MRAALFLAHGRHPSIPSALATGAATAATRSPRPDDPPHPAWAAMNPGSAPSPTADSPPHLEQTHWLLSRTLLHTTHGSPATPSHPEKEPTADPGPPGVRAVMETTRPGVQDDGTWRIPEHRLPELLRRAEILNRRVARTGKAGLSVETVRTESEEVPDPDGGRPRVRRWASVRISGEVPVVSGWRFVARVEHHAGIGNVVSRAPGCWDDPLPESLRTAEATCDHCEARRARRDTFVLRDGSGDLRRVGRNCLQDFLRGEDPEHVLRLWSLLSAIESLVRSCAEEGFGPEGSGEIGTTHFLACTVSAIRHAGWVSRAAARESSLPRQSTSDLATWLCGRAPQGESRKAWLEMQPGEADYEEAGEVADWASSLGEREGLSDYLHNLRVAVSVGTVGRRNAGIVASGVVARRRELEQEAREKAERERPAGSHFGSVGKRSDLPPLTVRTVRHLEGSYGVTTLVVMESEDGSSFKWFASGSRDHKPGDVLVGKGTVKAHETYRDRPVTVLTRCSLAMAPAVPSGEIPPEEEVPF